MDTSLSGCSTTLSPQASLILNWGCILCSLLQWAWHPSLKPGQKKWQPCPPSSPSGPCLITAHSTHGPIQVFPGLIQGSDEVSPSRNSPSHLLPLYWNPQGIQNAPPKPPSALSVVVWLRSHKEMIRHWAWQKPLLSARVPSCPRHPHLYHHASVGTQTHTHTHNYLHMLGDRAHFLPHIFPPFPID